MTATPFTTDDVDAAVSALANNAYLGEEGPLDRDDLVEIVCIVLSNANARGRLLPSGGKAETQWMIRDADGLESDYASDEREIRQSWAQGITWWDPDGSYELCRRSVASGPWEVVERHPVVSDNSEVSR